MKKRFLTALAFSASVTQAMFLPTSQAQVLPAALDCLVDYEFVRAQVFEKQCFSCHSGAKIKAGVDLSSFAEAVKHLSVIESVVKNDEMPPTSSLSPGEAEIVLAWIAQGAPENVLQETQCVVQ